MTAQSIHLAKINEHLQELKDAIAQGIEIRPATIGFHTSACAIDLLELYLHHAGKIPIGLQVKHEWFKRPKPGQKILPLAERNLKGEFPYKHEIIALFYNIEENRNKLIYGHATISDIKQTIESFDKLKKIMKELLGDTFEDPND